MQTAMGSSIIMTALNCRDQGLTNNYRAGNIKLLTDKTKLGAFHWYYKSDVTLEQGSVAPKQNLVCVARMMYVHSAWEHLGASMYTSQ